jgi:tRNA (uracil-5-)-methyltransferase
MPLFTIDPARYDQQLADKIDRFKADFARFNLPEPAVFESARTAYRMRAEFRVWHVGTQVHYAMFNPETPRSPILIEHFAPVAEPIARIMTPLRELISGHDELRRKLFEIDFLATLSGEVMVSLIYHRKLDETWADAARQLSAALGAVVIGRSRGKKFILERDWLLERFELDGRMLEYKQVEGCFTQPNGGVNRHMLGWARSRVRGVGGDLLELYCGNGNFTVALAPLFDKVLATELSKTSVYAAHYNLEANGVDNVSMVRMSSEDISDALAGGREYRRMKDVDLPGHAFSTLFVDPPRGGLDAATLALAPRFDRVLYISCNPESLCANLDVLGQTHRIEAAAAFDQFPYTPHLECGVSLIRR